MKEPRHIYSNNAAYPQADRIASLKKLSCTIKKYEKDLYIAFDKELGKNEMEVYVSEIGIVYNEIRFVLKNLEQWMHPKRVKTPIILPGRKSRIIMEPYGKVLIIGPFNYPFQLVMMPLIGAIAAGNQITVKPSELTPEISKIIQNILEDTFEKSRVTVFQGGVDVTTQLLEHRYDLIFFTGSERVGKIVHQAAALHLTPTILELGGKSPVIVTENADIKRTAQRIVWGKFLNNGQTCVAPDYLFVHENRKEELIQQLIQEIYHLYGDDFINNPDYGRIISDNHAKRLQQILNAHTDDIIFGGSYEGKYIEPTLLSLKSPEGVVMQEEIFGPILPIISYNSLDSIINYIQNHSKPLAMYLFTEDYKEKEKILQNISFGSGAINDCIIQLSNPYLPFGGVGQSGMGNYHGYHSFLAFSHQKSIIESSNYINLNIMMPPYTNLKKVLMKYLLR